MFKPRKVRFGVLGSLGFLLFVAGCGNLPNMSAGNSSPVSSVRRVFVNDPATNDSLVTALARTTDSGGLLFVLQPGQSYQLRVATDSTRDTMSIYEFTNYGFVAFDKLPPTFSPTHDTEIFTLQSNQSEATWFDGLMHAPDSLTASQRISHVGLVSLNSIPSTDTLNVNLIMAGDLSASGLADSVSKVAFADSFLSELGSIYQGVNGGFNPPIAFNGTYSIVSGPAEVLSFGSTFIPLPGTRAPNAANIYLINNITYPGGSPTEEILGFSPREVVDLSNDEDSRVVLSAVAATNVGGTGTITGGIPSLATTTAHELGHFFGLRHPTATTVDLANDNDISNKDDGFVSTPLCTELSKSGEHIVTASYNKRAYCLYVAVQGCLSDCDTANLMFAYSCYTTTPGARFQRQLTSEQQDFFRKNLALLQGK